jgi:hypothetical protein
MMRINILIILLTFYSCSSFTGGGTSGRNQESVDLRFTHPAQVLINNKTTKVTTGENVVFPASESIVIQAEGRMSMLLVPVKENSSIDIRLPELGKDSITTIQNDEVNKMMDSLFVEVQQIQGMILDEKYQTALSKISVLVSRFPDVAFLHFIEGSCYQILGRKNDAVRSVRRGLALYPQSQDGQELYRKLTGESF